jgi:protoheme IX farnesyltransferase
MNVAASAVSARQQTLLSDLIALTKPRIIVLLEITTVAAMIMAAHGMPNLALMMATVTGGALCAGGAGAINCWFDRDIDAAMGRTKNRPLPSGRISPKIALAWGITLGAAGFLLLLTTTNWLAATLAASALLFYVLVYTMYLKRSSPQNIVIGGAAGAIPPLVGWAAVTGTLSPAALFLAAIVFYWTPPHFWSLSLLVSGDYQKASVPMLPVVAGAKSTRQQILLWTAILVVVTLLPLPARAFGGVYAVGALVLDAVFVAGAFVVWRRPTARSCRRLFYYSILYLAALFAVMTIDQVMR